VRPKAGLESTSGLSFSRQEVRFNSPKSQALDHSFWQYSLPPCFSAFVTVSVDFDHPHSTNQQGGRTYVDRPNTASRVRRTSANYAQIPRAPARGPDSLKAPREIDHCGSARPSPCQRAGSGYAVCPGRSRQVLDFQGLSLQPSDIRQVLEGFEQTVQLMRHRLPQIDESRMCDTFRLLQGEKEVWALPRGQFLREIMFNH